MLDRRKKLAAEIEKVGVLFESKKVKDAQLPAFITSYMKRKGVDLDPKATSMLADFVGTDLSRLTGELEKTDYNSSKRSDTRHPRTDRT